MEIAPPAGPRISPPTRHMSRPLRVLIVEYHDPLRQILTELMRERGLTAYPTEHSHEALEMARRIELDIGLLDLHLPSGNGLDLFLTIAREIGPLPSIMMSGEATSSETDAALDAGVFSFLRKPIAIQHLQRSLDLLIERHFPNPPGSAPSAPGS